MLCQRRMVVHARVQTRASAGLLVTSLSPSPWALSVPPPVMDVRLLIFGSPNQIFSLLLLFRPTLSGDGGAPPSIFSRDWVSDEAGGRHLLKESSPSATMISLCPNNDTQLAATVGHPPPPSFRLTLLSHENEVLPASLSACHLCPENPLKEDGYVLFAGPFLPFSMS